MEWQPYVWPMWVDNRIVPLPFCGVPRGPTATIFFILTNDPRCFLWARLHESVTNDAIHEFVTARILVTGSSTQRALQVFG
jgi:hypothetical protein